MTQRDGSNTKLPEDLKTKVEQLTPFARNYAYYRSKGLNQPDAAKKAGSGASTRTNLTKSGWNVEQLPGVKEYIAFLQHQRASAALLDETEIIDKARQVFESAMFDGKYADANKAIEHLGNTIGIFAKGKVVKEERVEKKDTKNNISAFKDDSGEEETTEERLARIRKMMKD